MFGCIRVGILDGLGTGSSPVWCFPSRHQEKKPRMVHDEYLQRERDAAELLAYRFEHYLVKQTAACRYQVQRRDYFPKSSRDSTSYKPDRTNKRR